MKILCINPYVYDFAYHDLYAKPYGLLQVATFLKNMGHEVTFIDIPFAENYLEGLSLKRKSDGTGEFYRQEIEKPKEYDFLNRKYYRFGIPEDRLIGILSSLEKPHMILVTSMMTYWYPGVRDTIRLLRQVFPDVKIYLGGIYAKLLPDHARRVCKPDELFFSLEDELSKNSKMLYPDLESFYKRLYYIPLLTSVGCPFNCSYCASKRLFQSYKELDLGMAYSYIQENTRYFKTQKVAFIDDALLYNKENHIFKLLERVIREDLNVNFYTPNGLHIRYIDDKCAEMLYQSGFKKLRLSLEFIDDNKSRRYGNKTDRSQFERAVSTLRRKGFSAEQIGVYILTGIYNQSYQEVKNAIDYVYDIGAIPYLSEYSPVPGSTFFEDDKKHSIFDLSEPLYHNNLILPMRSEKLSYEHFLELKGYNREKRTKISGSEKSVNRL